MKGPSELIECALLQCCLYYEVDVIFCNLWLWLLNKIWVLFQSDIVLLVQDTECCWWWMSESNTPLWIHKDDRVMKWAWSVRNAYKANNKLGFFDGNITQLSSKACFVGDSYPTMMCIFYLFISGHKKSKNTWWSRVETCILAWGSR